jgi:phosphate transport system substrate-binding protein
MTTSMDRKRQGHRVPARRPGLGTARCLAVVGPLVLALPASDGRADVRAQMMPESLEIRGSGSVLPLAQRVAEAYMTDHPESIVVVSSGGNRRGLKSLILGTCEMAMAATEVPADLEKLASYMKVDLVSTEIYRDAVVAVVHPRNPIKDLSMKQLRDVFRGATTNWSELGGKDAPIVVTTHEATSGTFEIFKKAVLGDDAVITPKALVTHHEEFENSITEGAIGYTGLHDAGALKVLTVGGVAADVGTIASGQYPIRRTLRLYERKPETAIGKAVLAYFLARDKGQAFVRAMGDVPVK